MQQTPILIVGASVSGLALASCLQKEGLNYIIIEKQAQVATPWRNNYDRLQLHTPKACRICLTKNMIAVYPAILPASR